jgi:glycosyltransferase involved in cell wall biosynthesis
MKILLAIGSLGAGGAERVATTLVNAWAERGNSVILVSTFSGRGECFYPLAPSVKVIYLADRARTRSKHAVNFFERLLAFRDLIRQSRPDVVVSFLAHVNITTLAASLGLGIPVIACEHTNPLAAKRGHLLTLLARFFYPRASMLTVLTEGVVDAFKERMPRLRNLAVMPNPLPEAANELPRRTVANGARHRLIAVGRLHELKQFDRLISAFAELAADFPDWDLHIWGDGPARDELKQQIAALRLQQRATLGGTTPNAWREMAAADVYVLTSLFEGLPMAMMEAMAIGLPCVAFDCPSGPRELTRDGQDGVLVPANDQAALVSALRRLLGDPALRVQLGRQAAASVRERYSLNRILSLWDQLFVRVGARTETV